MHFQKIDETNITKLKPFFESAKDSICDFTAATVYMWADYYGFEYAIENGSLIIKGTAVYGHKATVFFPPLGDFDGGMRAVKEYCSEHKIPVILSPVTERILSGLEAYGSVKAVRLEGWSDYIYATEAFARLVGHKYNSKRNHVNKFMSEYRWNYTEINESNLNEVETFFSQITPPDSVEGKYEYDATLRLLKRLDLFDLKTGVLYANGKVAGFTIAEVSGETLIVHTEKADRNIDGSFETVAHLFCMANENLTYVNREEDMNSEGLRRAKESWHPLYLLDKYNVWIK